MLRPQSVVLTLYGDYVRQRGGEISIGSLLRLLGDFGLTDQAIRSALSRMVSKDLLRIRRVERKSYYGLTLLCLGLIARGERKIFQESATAWDGAWDVVVYSIPEQEREGRDRLRQELAALGFGALGSATWLSPVERRREVEELVQALHLNGRVQIFRAHHLGPASPQELVVRCWDLEKTNQKYQTFLETYRPRYARHRRRLEAQASPEGKECFVERFLLLHDFRRFHFYDPLLPRDLLPEGWLGMEAAALFRDYHSLLAEPANRYFDEVYVGPPSPRASPREKRAPQGWSGGSSGS